MCPDFKALSLCAARCVCISSSYCCTCVRTAELEHVSGQLRVKEEECAALQEALAREVAAVSTLQALLIQCRHYEYVSSYYARDCCRRQHATGAPTASLRAFAHVCPDVGSIQPQPQHTATKPQ